MTSPGDPDQSSPTASPGGSDRSSPECPDEVCVTCSDMAVPVRIVALRPGHLALADTAVGAEEISVRLVDARAGDVVLVHAKEAIAVLERTVPERTVPERTVPERTVPE